MSKIPFMPLYTSDYMGDTRHLSTEQHGAYLLLLMHSWSRGGRLPNNGPTLARIAGLSARRWKAISGDVLAMFEEDGAEIYSKRLTFEHTKATSKTESRVNAGRRGGQAKALKDKEAGLAKPQAKQVAKPCHLPDTRNHIEKEEGKPSSKSKGRGTRIPNDFALTPKLANYARAKGLNERQIQNEFEKFTNYFTAASGQSSVKRDWNRAWYNWSITASERAGGSGRGGQDGNVSLASTASRLLGGMADGGPVSEGGQVISGGGGGEDIW
jgi:uncharacterized protein YdaU (DUF1376 family)